MTSSTETGRAWLSTVAIPAIFMVVAGVGSYWALDTNARDRDYTIGMRLIEIDTRQKLVIARLDRIESSHLALEIESARRESAVKALYELQGVVRDLEKQIREHDQRQLPLGKRSGIMGPWRPGDG